MGAAGALSAFLAGFEGLAADGLGLFAGGVRVVKNPVSSSLLAEGEPGGDESGELDGVDLACTPGRRAGENAALHQ